MTAVRALTTVKRYGKTVLVCGWAGYLTYALLSGQIETSAAFDKLTGSDVISILLGAW